MESLTRITLNLQQPNVATIAYAVQNDRLSRHVEAQLVDGSQAWEPPAGALAAIRYLKPDGTAGFYDTDEAGNPATVIDGSTATMTLAEQTLTVPGDVFVQLQFYTGAGERLTTFCFLLRVQKNVLTDDEFISTDYYNILTEQIAAVLDAAAALTGMTATASGLPTGSDPTVVVTGGSEGEPYNLAFGIPAGPRGPAEIPTTTTTYQAGTSPTTAPTGSWSATPPSVPPGDYLWTRTVLAYSDGTDATYYTIARQGIDGSGSPGSQMPIMDGVGSPGSSTSFSREDHQHPTDTSRAEAATHVVKSYAAVSQVTSVSAPSIAQIWSALPVNSILIAPASQFQAADVPAQTGTVEMYKGASASIGWIEYHGLDSEADQTQAISSGAPSGTWNAAVTAGTIVVETVSGSTHSIGPGQNDPGSFSCAKPGYKPIAMSGFTTNSAGCCIVKMRIVGNTVEYNLRNVTTSETAQGRASVDVTYIKL